MMYFYDGNTGEEIIREMTDAEYAAALADKADFEAKWAETEGN